MERAEIGSGQIRIAHQLLACSPPGRGQLLTRPATAIPSRSPIIPVEGEPGAGAPAAFRDDILAVHYRQSHLSLTCLRCVNVPWLWVPVSEMMRA